MKLLKHCMETWITWEAKHSSREDIATSHTDVPEQVFFSAASIGE
jgi:hypothetical protein